jgi:hypothetical protein
MPSPTTPGSSNIDKFQRSDVDVGLRRIASGSALPKTPAIRFARAAISRLPRFTHLLRPASLLAPLHGSDRISPAIGDFYFWASSGSVALPAARYDYNSDWTPLLVGLSPTGMAARLAARQSAAGIPAASPVSTSMTRSPTGGNPGRTSHTPPVVPPRRPSMASSSFLVAKSRTC